MVLYLVRHGEARPEGPDADRQLTERGAADVDRIAQWLRRSRVPVAAIRHSARRRTKETAAILAANIGVSDVGEIEGIAPNSDPQQLDISADDLMIVSHLPFLERLVGLLVGGTDRRIVTFHPASIVGLRREHDGYAIEFVIHPAIV